MLEYVLLNRIKYIISNNIKIDDEALINPSTSCRMSINWIERKIRNLINDVILNNDIIKYLEKLLELKCLIANSNTKYKKIYLVGVDSFIDRINNIFIPEIYYKLFILLSKDSFNETDIKNVFEKNFIDKRKLLGLDSSPMLNQTAIYRVNQKRSLLSDIIISLNEKEKLINEVISRLLNVYKKEEVIDKIYYIMNTMNSEVYKILLGLIVDNIASYKHLTNDKNLERQLMIKGY